MSDVMADSEHPLPIPPTWLVFEGRLYGLRDEPASVVHRAVHVDRADSVPPVERCPTCGRDDPGTLQAEIERLHTAYRTPLAIARERDKAREQLREAVNVLRELNEMLRPMPPFNPVRVKVREAVERFGEQ